MNNSMSGPSRSVDVTAPQAPALAASRPRSPSAGFALRLRGWRPGFDKVRFTRLLRDGGLGLREAVDLTGRLLADQETLIRLGQYADRSATVARLADIGVAQIT